MPTTEERLAALEAKMAQLTDTRPTTYYTHQYSGEEIDAATGRALTGGALDTSVTNVSNQLGTFVRPNLLDNWYFGNPVDQRGGKIIQSGVNIYTDSTLKTLIGPAAYACPVVELTSTYAKVQDAKNTGSYYYAAPADVVRGYTGNQAFIIDRWRMRGDGVSIEIEDDGLVINCDGKSFNSIVQAYESPKTLLGEKVTYSVLVTENTNTTNCYIAIGSGNMSAAAGTELGRYTFSGTGLFSFTLDLPATMPNNYLTFIICAGNPSTNGARFKVAVAKLELGPTQTLAHQDAAGNWVLNEVPEYGEQLRRCQRYAIDLHGPTNYGVLGSGVARSTDRALIFCPLPVSMRVTPVATFGGSLTLASNADAGRGYVVTAVNVDHINSNGITLNVDTAGLTISTVYQLWRQGDASAHILLSADL